MEKTKKMKEIKPYLVRREQSCGVLYNREKKNIDYIYLTEVNEWIARKDVEFIVYSKLLVEGQRVRFGAPLILFMDITSRCMCQCWYCYNRSGRAMSEEMTKEEISGVIRRFAELGGTQVRLSGGEPTLHPDLAVFIELSNQLSLQTILVSNGMIPDDVLNYLKQSPVTAYYLSLQGDEHIHDSIRGPGSYAQCIHSAETLTAAGAMVRMSMVFHKQNQHCVKHIAQEAARIGANVAFNPLRPFGNATPDDMLDAEEHLRLVQEVVSLRNAYPQIRIDTPWDYLAVPPRRPYQKVYKRIGCGNSGLSITSTGDCFSCGQLCTFPEFSLGNVREDDIHTIWLRSRDSCRLANAPLSERCETCAYLYGSSCFGGCVATSLVVRGAMDAGDPYCFVDLLAKEV